MELKPTLWVIKHGIKNEVGVPIEFDDHRFLWDIYNDMSPLQVVLKAPQIGLSVLQVIKTMYCAKKRQWDIIYTLPTASDVNDFAGGKINRIIAQNPILREWVKEHDTVDQKALGNNKIYYRGTFTSKAATMQSSDLNVHDEVDASDASVIEQYETRLQAKKDGRRWYFSHPSLAGYGVDIQWQKSDKKEWFIVCKSCKEEQFLSFPENVDRASRQYVCRECNAPFSDEDRKMGEWKPTAEGEFSGYHISQLMCPWISADKVLKDEREKSAQYFWNMVLGLPFVGSEAKVSKDDVMKNVEDRKNLQEGTIIIGVDTGLPVHYMLMNKQGVFFRRTCQKPSKDYDPYAELESILKRFPKSVMVADQGGDLIGIRRLQAKYPNRVFLCYYRRDRKSQQIIRWGQGEESGIVTVDRNRMIQLIVDQLREGNRLRFQGTEEDWQVLADHFFNIYKVVEETPYGAEFRWERNGPDHYVHCLVYCCVGFDRFGGSMQAEIVGADYLSGLPIGRDFS